MVWREDAPSYKHKGYLLEECLGDMESVDIVRLSHNGRRRLGVTLGHGFNGCARGRKLKGGRSRRVSTAQELQKDAAG
jgi:hypothetical protein